VDSRLVAPESRYEVADGRVVYVAPADEPHGVKHAAIAALVKTHAAKGYEVAVDMLTRTSRVDDIAPDVSVFPEQRNPETGGRQLEELAFEVVSTERLNDAGTKAAKLVGRGVRRVFAVDVVRKRAFEWSVELGTWSILGDAARIEDPALGTALSVGALVHAAQTDDAMAGALLAKNNRVLREAIQHGRDEGKIELFLALLQARGFSHSLAVRLPSFSRSIDRRSPAEQQHGQTVGLVRLT